MLLAPLPTLRSQLICSIDGPTVAEHRPERKSEMGHLCRMLLEAVANGSVGSGQEVESLIKSTLLSSQVELLRQM